MSDLPLLIIIMAVALSYVSALIYISLRSRGLATPRIVRMLVELWAVFALVTIDFALLSVFLGPAPSGRAVNEILERVAQWGQLSPGQQAILLGGLIAALLLFAHFIATLRRAQR